MKKLLAIGLGALFLIGCETTTPQTKEPVIKGAVKKAPLQRDLRREERQRERTQNLFYNR